MPTSEPRPSAIFLDQVRQQLNGLEPSARREILKELRDHLHDALAADEAASSATAAAEVAAVQAMGDPAEIGRRLHDEHLNQRLPLPAALLCALPIAAFALLFRQTELYSMMRQFSSPTSGFPYSFLLALTPVIALSLVLLERTRQSWPAALLGGSGVLFLLAAAHGLRGAQFAPLAIIVFGFGLLALASIALTLGVTLRWGSFPATLALLGGVGVYGCYAWLQLAGPISTLALSVSPIIGVAVLGLTPWRRRRALAWAIFALNWALIILYAQHVVGELPVPGPAFGIFDLISPAFLIASAALLLAVQAVSSLQARSRLPLMDRWMQRLAG
jgi:hypothetical protein